MPNDMPSPCDGHHGAGPRPPVCPEELARRLIAAGLRPTRQRLALAGLLFGNGHRHVTAEQLHGEAVAACVPVSLATVYNTLNQFRDAGLLRDVVVDPGCAYFDTNIEDHHHLFHEGSGHLEDISGTLLRLDAMPDLPTGTRLARVDVIIRIADKA